MFSFGRLSDLIEKKKRKVLDKNKALRFAFEKPFVKTFTIELNLGQLQNNEDSNERSLGQYSNYTVSLRQDEGLPYADGIILYWTGTFYDSFGVKVGATAITITADTQKEDNDLAITFGEEIIGLSEDSIEKLSKIISQYVVIWLKETLLQ